MLDITQYNGIQLDIGCGAHKQPGYLGMDIQALPGVDLIHDWNIHPWPLPDSSVLRAIASHVIEHVPKVVIDHGQTRFPLIEFFDEVWRILKPDGEFLIACPHGYSPGYQQDPTHASAINESLFAYFDPDTPLYSFYRPKPWRIKFMNFDPSANIEVVLIKRELDA